MKISAYQCRFTGKIFLLSEKKEYVKYLKELRKSMRKERRHSELKKEFASWLAKEKQSLQHVDMIVPWILKNQVYLMNAYNVLKISPRGRWYPETDIFTDVKLTSVKYDYNLSNTHYCPHNGVTNWGRQDKSLPTGYPGFYGYISGGLKQNTKHSSRPSVHDFLMMIGLHTGTGGGGGNSWGYEAYLFTADWPGLQHQVDLMEQDLIVKKLKGEQ